MIRAFGLVGRRTPFLENRELLGCVPGHPPTTNRGVVFTRGNFPWKIALSMIGSLLRQNATVPALLSPFLGWNLSPLKSVPEVEMDTGP